MKKILILTWLAAAFAQGCAHPTHSTRGNTPTAAAQIESIPVASPHDADRETVVILGINDIHGALAPEHAMTREEEGKKAISYERGGAAIFASHLKILRNQFGNRLVALDAGDELQGSVESNSEEGAPMIQYLNSVGLQAAAVGNHEFDFGPVGPEGTPGDPNGALKARMSEAHYPYLSANLTEKATGKRPNFPNLFPHALIQAGRIKVGVIGLSTRDTPVTTRYEFVKNLNFGPLREAVVRESRSLRDQGADVIVVTAHVGLRCDLSRPASQNIVKNPTDDLGHCGKNDEMVELLESLPKGTIDAVVSGHSHTIVHHWIAGIPVVQAGTRMQYYNLVYLNFDLKRKRVIPDLTRIEGPVPICPEVFENQGDCNGAAPTPKDGRGSLVTPKLHGVRIQSDSETETLLKPIFARSAEVKNRKIGVAARKITHARIGESEMGNLVTDAIRKKVGADFALVNPGGIRVELEAGDITYGDLFRAFPFDNSVSLVEVTGQELRQILRVAENGTRGFFPTSGLEVSVLSPDLPAKGEDLNHDGKIEYWEATRLSSAKQADGEPIKDQKKYKLATLDFLVTGGDNMGWAFSKIPASHIQLDAGGIVRDVVMDYIKNQSPINSAEHPLIEPQHPRLKFVQTMEKKPSGRKHRRKAH